MTNLSAQDALHIAVIAGVAFIAGSFLSPGWGVISALVLFVMVWAGVAHALGDTRDDTDEEGGR
ncbi:hypothetical protein [Streptomyces sp.]|uniref:hypothetical protein n=1 Tax=Streptomyces sp. TaxID=1931 RepID=UPI002F922F5E